MSFRGVLLQGSGAWSGYDIKIFYVDGLVGGPVGAGQVIGRVQNLTTKYPGITNHIHMEVYKGHGLLDPAEAYQMCF